MIMFPTLSEDDTETLRKIADAIRTGEKPETVEYLLQWEFNGHVGATRMPVTGYGAENRDERAHDLCMAVAAEQMRAMGCFKARPFDPITDSDVEPHPDTSNISYLASAMHDDTRNLSDATAALIRAQDGETG